MNSDPCVSSTESSEDLAEPPGRSRVLDLAIMERGRTEPAYAHSQRPLLGLKFVMRIGFVALILFQSSSSLDAQESKTPSQPAVSRVIDDLGVEKRSIQRGLQYLASRRSPSGSIGSRFPVAVTSLAGLAFLGAGYSYREGPYTSQIEGCLEYILSSRDRRWFFSEGKSIRDYGESRMHGHCYALLFLTQIYGDLPLIKQKQVRTAIRGGVLCLLNAQSKEGGWDYSPDNQEQADEASITICALQALRAAKNVGFNVPKERIDLAMDYVRRCQSKSGAFQYSLTRNQNETTFALTVAALSTLQAAGIYDSPVFRKGMDHVRLELDRVSWSPRRVIADNFFFYGAMYTSQVFYQKGGKSWRRWHSNLRSYLLRKQKDDGRWEDDYGPEFATSMALLMLELPVQYLPIFQR